MSSYFPLERVEVISRRKYKRRQAVSEFNSERDERMNTLINSCIRDVDSMVIIAID